MRTVFQVAEEIVYEWQKEQPVDEEQRRIAPLLIKITEALTAFRNEGIEEAEKIIEQASAMPVFGLECSQYVASVFKDLLNKIRALKNVL